MRNRVLGSIQKALRHRVASGLFVFNGHFFYEIKKGRREKMGKREQEKKDEYKIGQLYAFYTQIFLLGD
jgi:hypothetical protein